MWYCGIVLLVVVTGTHDFRYLYSVYGSLYFLEVFEVKNVLSFSLNFNDLLWFQPNNDDNQKKVLKFENLQTEKGV